MYNTINEGDRRWNGASVADYRLDLKGNLEVARAWQTMTDNRGLQRNDRLTSSLRCADFSGEINHAAV